MVHKHYISFWFGLCLISKSKVSKNKIRNQNLLWANAKKQNTIKILLLRISLSFTPFVSVNSNNSLWKPERVHLYYPTLSLLVLAFLYITQVAKIFAKLYGSVPVDMVNFSFVGVIDLVFANFLYFEYNHENVRPYFWNKFFGKH